MSTFFKKVFLVAILFLFSFHHIFGQTEVDERAMVDFRKGLGFYSPDGTFGINIRTRMQNRLAFNFDNEFANEDIEARVSRLRLRFDGYIKSKKLTYYLQLSFSRGDQDWDNSGVPNVVRDAMVYYHFSKNFYLGFGQAKLPGNRQRIISSGQQQIYDRSVVNANYTLDRDFGLFGYYTNNLGNMEYKVKAAISTGDGRNQLKTDNGLMYTARVEFLPLGKFINDGDFSEGDLEFEKNPKISIAGGYSFNNKARRTRGTTGSFLYESKDMTSFFADLIVKYNGWAASAEYISRDTDASAISYNVNDSLLMEYVVIGNGIDTQLSYCFPSYWEIAARYAISTPYSEIRSYAKKDQYYQIGVNKYINKHLTKIQLFTGYRMQNAMSTDLNSKENYLLVFQVELGI